MKKLFLIIALSLSLNGCVAQQFGNATYREPKFVTAPFTVMYAKGGEAVLFTHHGAATYEVGALDLKADREYYFILQVAPCDDCEWPRQANVMWYGTSPLQANKDIKDAIELHKKVNKSPLSPKGGNSGNKYR